MGLPTPRAGSTVIIRFPSGKKERGLIIGATKHRSFLVALAGKVAPVEVVKSWIVSR